MPTEGAEKIPSRFTTVNRLRPDKSGGLNGSTQHLLELYLQEYAAAMSYSNAGLAMLSAIRNPRQISRRCLLVHFGFAVDAGLITRQDNGVPFFRAIAARAALVSSGSLHRACANSCRIARSSKSSMGICQIALSSAPRIDALITNAPSRNVSRFGR